MTNRGSLTLVGAGPGDAELITIKGVKAIKNADVILYDALVNKELLTYNPNAEKFYVGKRKGAHYLSQDDINALILEHTQKNKNVVRLKGGDVSIFARATEELKTASLVGIETHIIPGISSYAGIAAKHQIPLTKRCAYESLWITTGYTCDGKISKDLNHAAQSSATVVVFMGISKIKEIESLFLKHKPTNYPVAIVQNGTLENEKKLITTLENLSDDVEHHKLGSPALLIFGEAVVDEVCTLLNNSENHVFA